MRRGELHALTPQLYGGEPQEPFLIGETAFWMDWADRSRILYGSFDQPTALYLETPGSDIRNLATDGEHLAWALGVGGALGAGGPYERVEIWAAPYAPDPADLQPQFVAEVPDGQIFNPGILSNGMYVYADFASYPEPLVSRVVFYEIDTGARYEYLLPQNYEMVPPVVYATPDEIAVVAGVRRRSTIFRIARSAFSLAK